MVFKRYIKRHGKKLGPYYYENVRSRDGKVKSVYVGANPHQHPKHKIRKPLFFLILALVLILALGGSLFLIQNKSYVINNVGHEEPDFEVDQILLKVLIRQGESIEKQLRVTNIGSGPSSLSIDVQGLSDLVNADSMAFTIKPGQTKILLLNFSSFIAAESIEQQPGIYVGKLVVSSEKAAKDIPMVIEIETKNILFDMNLNPVAIERRVKQGTDTTIEVRLFNLESIESQNVDVEYFVKDMNGNTIVSESETVVAKTQASFFKTVSIPKNLKPGPYVFAGRSKFGNSVGTSSYLFEVVGPEQERFVQFCRNSILCLGLSLSTMLLIIALIAYFYFFMGAYIYEKVTGIEILEQGKEKARERKAEAFEKEGPSFFERLKARLQKRRKIREIKPGKKLWEMPKIRFAGGAKARIGRWWQEREQRKQEKERLEKEKELESIIKEKGQEAEAAHEEKQSRELRRFHRILDDAYNALESEDLQKTDRLYSKARDIYDILSGEERLRVHENLVEVYNKRNALVKTLAQSEENRREIQARAEKEKVQRLEREKIAKERKEKIKEVFHRIGFYKTAEEKRQRDLQKETQRKEEERKNIEEIRIRGQEEKRRLEEARKNQIEEENRNEKIRKQGELEKKQKEDEIRQNQIRQEKARQEELKRSEELKKQRELEEKQKEEEQRKQKELERQENERLKEQRLAEIKQLESKISQNGEKQKQLGLEISRVEKDFRERPNKIKKLDEKIKNIDSQSEQKSRQYEELEQKKALLAEEHKRKIEGLEEKEESEKNLREARLNEVMQKLAAEEGLLMQGMMKDIGKMSPAKRKATEKWKRLEVKAKLKIEEQELMDTIPKEEKISLSGGYKNSLADASKSQKQLKKEIYDLSRQKEQLLQEKAGILSNADNQNKKILEARRSMQKLALERNEFVSGLRKIKPMALFKFNFPKIFSAGKSEKPETSQARNTAVKTKKDKLNDIEERIKSREKEREEEEKKKDQAIKLEDEEKRKQKQAEKTLQKSPERQKETKKVFDGLFEKAEDSANGSRNLEKCTKLISDAKNYADTDREKAKKLYLDARNKYLELDYHEKKEVYENLMDLYNKIIK